VQRGRGGGEALAADEADLAALGELGRDEPAEELPVLDVGVQRGQVLPVPLDAGQREDLHVRELLRDADGAVGELAAPADHQVVALGRELPVDVRLVGHGHALGEGDLRADLVADEVAGALRRGVVALVGHAAREQDRHLELLAGVAGRRARLSVVLRGGLLVRAAAADQRHGQQAGQRR
jgi:hypothetical protein